MPILRPPPHADYYVSVARGARTPHADVYAWSVRDPLPTIPIPLRSPDADVMLDLAALFSRAYERGRYERALRYDQPLRAPLSPEDRRWAEELAAPMRRPSPQPPV